MRQQLEELLDEVLQRPHERPEIEQRIRQTFGEERAVMVLDMTGCSRTAQTHGIVPCLVMIHQLRKLADAPIRAHGGTIVKAEGDNLFCLFDCVEDAVASTRAIAARLDAVNVVLPRELELYASIGIGFGPVLNLGDDLWGNEVNLASKLGEDLAGHGEVLLTETAAVSLGEAAPAWEERSTNLSGLELRYYALLG